MASPNLLWLERVRLPKSQARDFNSTQVLGEVHPITKVCSSLSARKKFEIFQVFLKQNFYYLNFSTIKIFADFFEKILTFYCFEVFYAENFIFIFCLVVFCFFFPIPANLSRKNSSKARFLSNFCRSSGILNGFPSLVRQSYKILNEHESKSNSNYGTIDKFVPF